MYVFNTSSFIFINNTILNNTYNTTQYLPIEETSLFPNILFLMILAAIIPLAVSVATSLCETELEDVEINEEYLPITNIEDI